MDEHLGEARHPAAPVRFGKKDYTVGKRYSWEDLPPAVRKDVENQEEEIESRFGRDPRTLRYRLVIIPHADLVRHLEDRYGARYTEKLRDPKVLELARDIDRRGLQSPPVLEKGLRRALAIASLGWDMPYFTVDEPISMPEPTYIPTLDGRWPDGRYPLGR